MEKAKMNTRREPRARQWVRAPPQAELKPNTNQQTTATEMERERTMKELFVLAIVACVVPATMSLAAGTNLITNGDFEAGNTGFWSDYTYAAPSYDALWPERCYTVHTNTNASGIVHHLWTDYTDHTTGSGRMLIVNGDDEVVSGTEPTIWGQDDIPVQQNRTYVLTYYVRTCYPAAPATLRCTINGIQVGLDAVAPDLPGAGWLEVSYEWYSGSNTAADIRLLDLNNEHTGNDFTIDDISLYDMTITVGIDIKPGSCPNAFNNDDHGVIPVAILGSATFDVSLIDVGTLSLQGLAVRVKGNGAYQFSIRDVSGNFSNTMAGEPDGYPDLVCQFVDADGIWSPGDSTATVTGNLMDGTPFTGSDSIKITQ